jgi:hypothetical protein
MARKWFLAAAARPLRHNAAYWVSKGDDLFSKQVVGKRGVTCGTTIAMLFRK